MTEQGPGAPTPPTPPPAFDEVTLKAAMTAYRKRLKAMRLDDESRGGRRALSAGRKSAITGIVPPSQFPQAVWDELVRRGKLRTTDQEFYELVGE